MFGLNLGVSTIMIQVSGAVSLLRAEKEAVDCAIGSLSTTVEYPSRKPGLVLDQIHFWVPCRAGTRI